MANAQVGIGDATATVEGDAIVASFTLEGGPIDGQWKGAFARAIEGSVAGIAKRWHLDGPTSR